MTTRSTRWLAVGGLVLTTALAYTTIPSAWGEDTATKYDPRAAFAEADTNHDGVVDHEEFHVRITEVFFSADRNKDGFLDAKELKQLAFPDDFTTDDKDADGRVSMREFMRVRLRDFTTSDKNDDGVLSVEEVVAAYEGRRHK